MSMFDEEQEQIRQLIHKEKYNEAINICTETLQYLEDNSIDDDNCYWFCYLRLAICYRRLSQYKKAIIYANKSSLHAMEQKETMECWWTLGSCYYSSGNIKMATKFYERCKDYYQRVNDQNGYDNMDFNIAKINKDVKKTREIIKRLNRTDNNGYLVDNAYAFLCELYAENNQMEMINKLVHNIHSKTVLEDMENTIAKYNIGMLCVL